MITSDTPQNSNNVQEFTETKQTHILIARSIFCPNSIHYDITTNNLLSLFNFLTSVKKPGIIFSLYVVGWLKYTYIEYITKIIKLYSHLFKEVKYDLWLINYGKYKMLNNLKQQSNSYDAVFYSDHDIKMPVESYNNTNFFNNLHMAIHHTINNMQIGLIALNHLEDVRHQCDIYQNHATINDVNYMYPDLGQHGSIACGCFYIKGNVFHEIKDFKLYTVYGMDDYYLLKKLHNKGYINVVIENVFVIHPFNDDYKYNEWKTNKIINILENINGHDKIKNIDYYKDIQQSNNFWNGM